ncbi:peptide chain release factor H [Fluviicola chungangensis]|uniref:Peptide chain release factor H n=1 Tax=Fluviicola chungangensis TaxID=2597671 RepID=A0A556MXV5_9FLAO|nr:peptide chain release factor H [Fluviicola chungangensis]TSJ44751.1 peptide chain release factor H [Fluviicola chungangensis]
METKLVHITTAKGPLECQLAAGKILAALLAELRQKGVQAEVIDRTAGQENGTILSATIQINGIAIQTAIQSWLGTIQWIQQSPYRPNHGRKNWFVGIFEVNPVEITGWDENEISYQSVRSSGAGGQHVNKVSSAVRAIHKPSGTMVFVQESRSQLQNKKIARERIREKLEKVQSEKLVSVINQTWSQHQELERGNPVRTFTGMDFKPKKAEKTFKKQRNKLKQELKKELNG